MDNLVKSNTGQLMPPVSAIKIIGQLVKLVKRITRNLLISAFIVEGMCKTYSYRHNTMESFAG